MRFRYHRNMLISVALLLTLLSEITIFGIGYWNINDTGSEIRRASEQNIARHIESQMISKLNEMNSLALQLEQNDFILYARSFYSLRPPEEELIARQELSSRLEQLHLPPEMVERIYFIGDNINQKNFGKSMKSGESMDDSQIPWIEDLQDAGLLDLLTRYYGMPAYIPEGMLSSVLEEKRGLLPPETWDRLSQFTSSIEGHLIINNGVNALNVLSVIVFDERILTAELPSSRIWSGYAGILDENQQILWTNVPEREAMEKAVKLAASGETEWEQSLDGRYYVRNVPVPPYGIRVIIFEQMQYDSIGKWGTTYTFIIFLACSMLLSLVIAYRLANAVMYPYQALARAVWKKENDLDFRSIPEQRFSRGWLSRFTIRKKMLIMLLSSVLIPVLLAIVMYVFLMYRYVFDKAVDLSVESSDHLVTELQSRVERYENLTNRLSTDSRLTNLTSPYLYRGNMDDFTVSSYPGLNDISYFVIYDVSGVAKYSSVFNNNRTLFKLHSYEKNVLEQLEAEEMVWLTGLKDVYGHPALMLVKKLEVSSGVADRQITAFLQVVLKEDAFSYATTDRKQSFVILDHEGKLIYSHLTPKSFQEAAVSQWSVPDKEELDVQIQQVEGSNQVVIQRGLEKPGWYSYIFMTINDVYLKIHSMFYRFGLLLVLIIMIILLVMRQIAYLLVRPIERLKQAIENEEPLLVGRTDTDEAQPRDEIGRLVASFNQMLRQIRELMQENVDKEIREKKLVTSRMKAELGMLQQQINPHFLYNTLEAINMRARQYGATEVSTMVNSLAKIFRFTINTGSEVVALSDELEHARNYLTIQELRFQNKFIVRWELDDQAMKLPVLKFILQPIIENALQHGIEDLYGEGELLIRTKLSGLVLILTVQDNGIGMSEEELERVRQSLMLEPEAAAEQRSRVRNSTGRSSGVGLINVYQRLRLYYGEPLKLSIESEEFQGTTVTINLPIQEDKP
ncbi:histidine kinase [Paenibacillus motobuensis]|uniref:sensor histidine kinase n=1 Tax=Paenibacillus TaxID=44249 RepID=UPI002041EAA9|nr:histidine kinase [Paenibacillus lutimineralis]MCM3649234.1 histidine kinase [Paenibacillus motobuensis]